MVIGKEGRIEERSDGGEHFLSGSFLSASDEFPGNFNVITAKH